MACNVLVCHAELGPCLPGLLHLYLLCISEIVSYPEYHTFLCRWMSNVSLHTFTLGNIPPRVFGMKVCLFTRIAPQHIAVFRMSNGRISAALKGGCQSCGKSACLQSGAYIVLAMYRLTARGTSKQWGALLCIGHSAFAGVSRGDTVRGADHGHGILLEWRSEISAYGQPLASFLASVID